LQLKVDVGLNEYRHYYNSKLKRQMQSCTLIQNVRQTTACKSRGEFDAFVSQYMEKQR
jgi:hypothetical protein